MGCSLDHDWIKNICIPFDADPDIAVVVGNYQVNLESIKSPAAWADYYYSSYEIRKLKKGSLPFNRSVAYKKWAWNLLGGLPEDLSFAGDDTVMGLQLINSELRIEYVEDALVYWDRFSEIRDFWKEKYRYGYGNGEANIFYPELMMRVGYQPSMLHFWLHSLFIAIKRSVKPIFRSLLDGRLSPIVFIPLLILGDQIAYAKGFIEGNRAGKTSCISTRKRLLGITNL
jgi:cellulose synthase/poly-beta-1,6-N-acetylglucosamine synthase-like glycosyltransferase